MRFDVLGDPDDGVTLDLDHRAFSYAGKFVMSNTGKAVARAVESDDVLAAVAFNRDRTDERTWWLRYITVREDRQGEGIGPRLADHVADRLLVRDADRVRIAVNNPFAYQALYKAGFGYTGRTTGLAELVLERPPPAGRDPDRYRSGFAAFLERGDLPTPARTYAAAHTDAGPPAPVATADG